MNLKSADRHCFLLHFFNVCREIGFYSALFTSLVRWHASTVGLPLGDVIFIQLAWRLNDVIFATVKNN
jgi:hypothetical protein